MGSLESIALALLALVAGAAPVLLFASWVLAASEADAEIEDEDDARY